VGVISESGLFKEEPLSIVGESVINDELITRRWRDRSWLCSDTILSFSFAVIGTISNRRWELETVGSDEGWQDGSVLGSEVGCTEGCKEGFPEGSLEGWELGWRLGWRLGWMDGCPVGWPVGRAVGRAVGLIVGLEDGLFVGTLVGRAETTLVGFLVLILVGEGEGL